MGRKTKQMGDGSFIDAIVIAIRDLAQPKVSEVNPVPKHVRIDGKTCLITGANSGLGRAAAAELARRGANMILACRPGHTKTCDEIKKLSGSENVEMMEVDLSDLRSVHRLCDQLSDRNMKIDIAVLNAGLALQKATRTPQGYETMFTVHFLANRVMIDRWLKDGVIRPSGQAGETPRIIFVSSEAHRSSHTIDFDRLGEFTDYKPGEGFKYYGISKLVMCTFATELSRRLNTGGRTEVAVHSMCPGGVATNISRETPLILKPIVNPLLRYFFQSPKEAIGPVIYLCCAGEAGTDTGIYLHLMQRKSVSPAAANEENGTRLWEASEPLVADSRE
ncbi:MAG: SDR family NAD(P)-dependent oxidoreductase [Candidatus Dadabacteria bacterium]|nr:SDR family NAD(P)-dependent oxidoreductase [Candidatus Dadabacteria bacterium]MDE0662860.1 SDR family NAD(P)-dependent oxidoreductase [Candidatus Dadabacteria bacterium]